MLKTLLLSSLKHPVRLLALCLVVYMAAMSFFVGLFVGGLVIASIRSDMKKKARAVAAAEAEAQKAAASQVQSRAAEVVKAPAAVDVAPPVPVREYAKSAVVIPFRTGTRN